MSRFLCPFLNQAIKVLTQGIQGIYQMVGIGMFEGTTQLHVSSFLLSNKVAQEKCEEIDSFHKL